MNQAYEVGIIITPIFVLIFTGYFLKRYNIVKHSWVKVLNDFVYFVSLPALIFQSFYKVDWDADTFSSLFTASTFLLLVAVSAFIFLALLPLSGKLKSSLFLITTVANSVYMGFPIIENYSNLPSSEYAIIPTLVIVFGIISGLVAIEIWVEKSKKISRYVNDLARNPLLIALFAGIIASFLPPMIFSVIDSPLSMIASTASPLALFTLGAFMHGKFAKHHILALSFGVIAKIIIIPISSLFLLAPFGINKSDLSIIVLSTAMPVAVTAFVLSEKYELDSKLVASGIVVSTLISIVSLALLLSHLQRI